MVRKILIGVGIVLAVIIVVEVVALLVMKSSVARYAQYWHNRAGQPAQDNAFVYIALGDSTAQGIGATSAANSYVGLIAEQLEKTTGRSVRVINLSVTGAKVADVLGKQLPALQQYGLTIDQADLVTMEIGANNLLRYEATSFEADYRNILAQLPADKTVISDMPYFGGRIDVKGNDVAASNLVRKIAESYDIPVAQLYQALRDKHGLRIYAADYFHPSNYGYTIWYDAFWEKIEKQ